MIRYGLVQSDWLECGDSAAGLGVSLRGTANRISIVAVCFVTRFDEVHGAL